MWFRTDGPETRHLMHFLYAFYHLEYMKIRSISVQGLFNEFDYEISLFPELTFIHSSN